MHECVSYDNLSLYNFTVGCTSKSPPMIYVTDEPINQKDADATAGPRALANAPNERKMPSTVPF